MFFFLPVGVDSYIRKHSLRLPLAHLDRACSDGRYPSTTALELIFAPVADNGSQGSVGATETAAGKLPALRAVADVQVQRDSSDAALEPASRYWDEVDRRKVRSTGALPQSEL